MTRTIKTNPREAQEILMHRRFIFRSDKEFFKVGDVLQFMVIRNEKPALHSISNKYYLITSVDDCMTAPVQRGFKLLGIREMQ